MINSKKQTVDTIYYIIIDFSYKISLILYNKANLNKILYGICSMLNKIYAILDIFICIKDV